MNKNNTIAFAGGGTGGHIYPGLAVIGALRKISGARIIYIGSENGMDRKIVESAGIDFFGISSGKLRRYFSLQNFFDIFKIIIGFFDAVRVLKKQKVDFVFSKGGFVSVPPVIAASFLKIPVWTHESDFSPGLATKINSVFAQKVCIAYEKTAFYFNAKMQKKMFLCGNPVRQSFYAADPQKGRSVLNIDAGKKILLVLGGSQGAKEINDLVTNCLDCLTKYFFVVHQTGGGWENKINRDNYCALPYINEDMPHILAAADLVLGRSGAGTVWESAALGKAMVLVPLSGEGTRGDQVQNASYFEEKGAAIMLVHPSNEALCGLITDLVNDTEKLAKMKTASYELGKINSAELISKSIAENLQG